MSRKTLIIHAADREPRSAAFPHYFIHLSSASVSFATSTGFAM